MVSLVMFEAGEQLFGDAGLAARRTEAIAERFYVVRY